MLVWVKIVTIFRKISGTVKFQTKKFGKDIYISYPAVKSINSNFYKTMKFLDQTHIFKSWQGR